jgi:hypothetical protein
VPASILELLVRSNAELARALAAASASASASVSATAAAAAAARVEADDSDSDYEDEEYECNAGCCVRRRICESGSGSGCIRTRSSKLDEVVVDAMTGADMFDVLTIMLLITVGVWLFVSSRGAYRASSSLFLA